VLGFFVFLLRKQQVIKCKNLMTYPRITKRVAAGAVHLNAWYFDIAKGARSCSIIRRATASSPSRRTPPNNLGARDEAYREFRHQCVDCGAPIRELRADAVGAILAGRGAMIAALKHLGSLHPQPLPDKMATFGIAGGGSL
jgi:hypothetical protein